MIPQFTWSVTLHSGIGQGRFCRKGPSSEQPGCEVPSSEGPSSEGPGSEGPRCEGHGLAVEGLGPAVEYALPSLELKW